MATVNENGLTYERWLYAAGFEHGTAQFRAAKSSTKIRAMWRAGEDPADVRRAKQEVDRERQMLAPHKR